jgi:DNA-binding NtrC family response regulator
MTAPRRVLVVDDDPFMVKTLTDVLRLSGWDVDSASSGPEAIDVVSKREFDAVLMDVKMPGMDGVTALKVMKARRPNARVFLMTAYAAHELLAEAEREGVARILPKPVNVPVLLGLLTRSVDAQRPVLVVDTDAAFLKTLADVLTLRGFSTVTARSLDEAMRLVSEEHPRAVLLHIHLGAIQPEDAITAVHEAGPSSSLIVYSGQPQGEESIPRALPREWIHAYLQKPFAVEHITGVLDEISAR